MYPPGILLSSHSVQYTYILIIKQYLFQNKKGGEPPFFEQIFFLCHPHDLTENRILELGKVTALEYDTN
jgi:hypothetical protein